LLRARRSRLEKRYPSRASCDSISHGSVSAAPSTDGRPIERCEALHSLGASNATGKRMTGRRFPIGRGQLCRPFSSLSGVGLGRTSSSRPNQVLATLGVAMPDDQPILLTYRVRLRDGAPSARADRL
jgi:hypothetical protein